MDDCDDAPPTLLRRVSGGAAKLRPTGYAELTEVAWSTHHYLDIAVWHDHMIARPIDHEGRQFDRVELAS